MDCRRQLIPQSREKGERHGACPNSMERAKGLYSLAPARLTLGVLLRRLLLGFSPLRDKITSLRWEWSGRRDCTRLLPQGSPLRVLLRRLLLGFPKASFEN